MTPYGQVMGACTSRSQRSNVLVQAHEGLPRAKEMGATGSSVHAKEQLQQNPEVALAAFPHGSKQVLPGGFTLEGRALNRHLNKPD